MPADVAVRAPVIHSQPVRLLSVSCALLLALSSVAHSRCLKPTEPLAGTLRKVTSRIPSSGELITNWHIVLSEPVCVMVDGEARKNILDVQVDFAKGVDLKAADDLLGTPVGVQGAVVDYRGERDTGDFVVTDAKFYEDLNDAGEVRR